MMRAENWLQVAKNDIIAQEAFNESSAQGLECVKPKKGELLFNKKDSKAMNETGGGRRSTFSPKART